jgi:hypothetical protein
MPHVPGIRRVFRLATRRAPVADDLDAELAFHFDMTVAELTAQGLDETEARAEAARRFGDASMWRGATRSRPCASTCASRRAGCCAARGCSSPSS